MSETPRFYGDTRIKVTEPTMLTIKHPDGRDLLVFHSDGTVTGDVGDASEAARVFVAEVQRLWGQPTPAPQARAGESEGVGE